MRWHIGRSAFGDQRLSEVPRKVHFYPEPDEPHWWGGEFTAQELRERMARLRSQDQDVPPEWDQALKRLGRDRDYWS